MKTFEYLIRTVKVSEVIRRIYAETKKQALSMLLESPSFDCLVLSLKEGFNMERTIEGTTTGGTDY